MPVVTERLVADAYRLKQSASLLDRLTCVRAASRKSPPDAPTGGWSISLGSGVTGDLSASMPPVDTLADQLARGDAGLAAATHDIWNSWPEPSRGRSARDRPYASLTTPPASSQAEHRGRQVVGRVVEDRAAADPLELGCARAGTSSIMRRADVDVGVELAGDDACHVVGGGAEVEDGAADRGARRSAPPAPSISGSAGRPRKPSVQNSRERSVLALRRGVERRPVERADLDACTSLGQERACRS